MIFSQKLKRGLIKPKAMKNNKGREGGHKIVETGRLGLWMAPFVSLPWKLHNQYCHNAYVAADLSLKSVDQFSFYFANFDLSVFMAVGSELVLIKTTKSY